MTDNLSPKADAAPDDLGAAHPNICLNCQTRLLGSHCHSCGQKAHLHRSLFGIWHDVLHGVLHFEGPFWRSLPLLFWKPGELTRRYIHGERKNFMSPVAIFLMAVFLTYAVFSVIGANGEAQLAEKPQAVAQHVEQALDQAPNPVAAAGELNEAASSARQVDSKQLLSIIMKRVDFGHDALNKRAAEVAQNPELLLYKLQANAYKYAWGLIPLSTLAMWLLFPFSRRLRLYDHFIFVTYSLAFVLFLSVIMRLLALTPLGSLGIYGAVLWICFHNFRHLRGAYDLSVGGAMWRTIALLFLSLMVATGFLALLILTGSSGM